MEFRISESLPKVLHVYSLPHVLSRNPTFRFSFIFFSSTGIGEIIPKQIGHRQLKKPRSSILVPAADSICWSHDP